MAIADDVSVAVPCFFRNVVLWLVCCDLYFMYARVDRFICRVNFS